MRVTQVLRIDPLLPFSGTIALAAELIREGKLVVFPTETVYGLGANALSEAAVRAIFEAKGRPSHNPLIVHVFEVAEAMKLTTEWPETAVRLTAAFWPGPLTLVLPRTSIVPDLVTAGGSTVAIRCPAHPVARALLHAAHLPIAAPSANRSGQLSPTRAEHVRNDLEGRVDLILDGGPTTEGIESTVVDLSGTHPRLLRPGTISVVSLEAIIGPLQRNESSETGTVLRSPGLLSRHYAPRTPLKLFHNRRDLGDLPSQPLAIVSLGVCREIEGRELTYFIAMPDNPKAYAARLYDELHRLDEMGLSAIYLEMPPVDDDWLAIRDRLKRAAFNENSDDPLS